MSVNGKICWSKANILGTIGTQQCGGGYKEEHFRVTGCYGKVGCSSQGSISLKVRVWTSLDADPKDESFGIDNVVIERVKKGNAGFRTATPCQSKADGEFLPEAK